MPNRKDWQPEDTQVETAALTGLAAQDPSFKTGVSRHFLTNHFLRGKI